MISFLEASRYSNYSQSTGAWSGSRPLKTSGGPDNTSPTPPGERRGTHKLKTLGSARKQKSQTSHREAPQATNLQRGSDPWRTEGMLKAS